MRNILTLALLIAELYVVSAQGGCEDGWSRSPDKCLSLFGQESIDGADRLTWFQADEACKAMDAQLANIKTQATQPIITALLSQAPASNVWIGLNDNDEEGDYIWSDGTALNDSVSPFTNWGPDQPDNANNAWEEDCVYLRAYEEFPGEWYDGFCYYPRAYICEKDHDPLLPTLSTSVQCGTSDPNYILFEQACYKLDRTERTYDDAKTFCEDDQDGVTLTTVFNAFEEAFLKAVLLNGDVNTAWIGLETQVGTDSLAWLDTSRLTFDDWAEDQPHYTTRRVIVTPEGWQDVNASESHPAICKKALGKPPEFEGSAPGSICPSGMNDTGDFCVAADTATFSWQEAQEQCATRFGSTSYLASVHNSNENMNLVYNAFTTIPPPSVYMWIGLNDIDRDRFQWVDGSMLNYVDFSPAAPDKQCVAMLIKYSSESFDVEWETLSCSTRCGFICRAPKIYVPPPVGGCVPGWFQLGINCYKAWGVQEADRRAYSEADEQCRREGQNRGKLFQVTNQLEQSLLALLLEDYVGVTNLWIGLSDSEEEGQFVWSDGTPMGFSQWAPNQPNGFTEVPNEPFRDCVEVRTDPEYLGEWDDVNCLEQRGYICQSPLYPDMNSTNVVVPEMCEEPSGYSKFKDGCYKLINETLSFDQAQMYCSNEGAWLSTVRDGFYNSLLTLLVNWNQPTPEYVWIGLRQDNQDDAYGWERVEPDDTRWPLTYAKWEKGSPMGQVCVALHRNSTWVDMACDTQNMFVCEYTDTEGPPVPELTHCADGWTYIEGHCYKFDTLMSENPQIHFSFSEAQNECKRRYNATLPGIHSLSANNRFSIEAMENLGDRNVWLGLYRSAEGYYMYQDGRVIDYVNWNSDATSDETNCVTLNTATGRWDHTGCFALWALVCESDPLPGPPNLCDDGWVSNSNYCYYVGDATNATAWKSWTEAEEWCNEHQAYLTTVDEGAERSYIYSVIELRKNSFWIGLNNRLTSGQWLWANGDNYQLTDDDQWSKDDVPNENNMEHCVLINENALWEDHNCGTRRPFICKQDPAGPTILPPPMPAEGECLNGAYKLKDSCYDLRFMEEPKTWLEAHKECQYLGGDLAAMHSQGVQALLSFALKNVNNNVWIGLNRLGNFDQYSWADGSPLDFENWAIGEPNNPFQDKDDENRINSCVQMSNNPTYAGRWSDVNCETENGFICEMPLDPRGVVQPLPYVPCPGKSNYHSDGGESCFRIIDTEMEFPNAMAKCEEDGAVLASVGDAYEQAFIEMFMSYMDVDMVWLGLRREAGQFEWLDTWPILYTNWANGYPTGASSVDRCGLVTHEGWKNMDCYQPHPMVCKTSTATKPSVPQPPSGSCRTNWYLYQGKCYYYDMQNTQVSFAEGLVMCRNRDPDAVLASSTNSLENSFLQNTGRTALEVNSIWLGGIYDDGEFEWLDGSMNTYTNWASDQPQLPIGSDICVQLMTEGAGQWKNTGCFTKAGYICEAPQLEVTTPITTTKVVEPPPPKPEPQSLSTEAIIGISVGCGGVLLIILLAATCYFTEKSHMKRKMYAKHRGEAYQKPI